MMSCQSGVSGLRHLKCSWPDSSSAKRSPFLVLFLLVASLKNIGRRSQYFNKTGLVKNGLLMNQKNSGSCRCVCRKLHVERSSCDGITCFSNGCCNVGNLVETTLPPLSFLLEVLGGRVSSRCKGHPK
jgi:hypothetical protein